MSSALRVLRTLRALADSEHGLTVRELAERSRVDHKTVRRDLDTLRRAGWKLTASKEQYNRRRWRLSTATVRRLPFLSSSSVLRLRRTRG